MAQIIELRATFFHQHGVYVFRVFSFIRPAIHIGAKVTRGMAVICQCFAVICDGEDLSSFA
jgi:hypothetical protein